MIRVNKVIPQTVAHFDPDDNLLGYLNEYECLDLRTQIANEKAFGYYLMFVGRKIKILPDGKLEAWAVGLYDYTENKMTELFTIQRRL